MKTSNLLYPEETRLREGKGAVGGHIHDEKAAASAQSLSPSALSLHLTHSVHWVIWSQEGLGVSFRLGLPGFQLCHFPTL